MLLPDGWRAVKRLWSLAGPYVFYCGQPSCPVGACRGLPNCEWTGARLGLWGPRGRAFSSHSLCALGGLAYFLFDSFPFRNKDYSDTGRQARLIVHLVFVLQTFSSTGDYVFRGTENICCTLNSSRKTSGFSFPPPPTTLYLKFILPQSFS